MTHNCFYFVDPGDFLLTCEGGRELCYIIPLQPQNPTHPIALSINLYSTPLGISYDPIEKRIYWTTSFGYILQSSLNDSFLNIVIRGLGRPMGIEIDITGRNIYFADESDNSIRVARLDGSHQASLVKIDSPQGITLDSSSG